ncbi:hypothetical protein [Desulfurivibrio alkaliphilus]|uniref:hypothetical protein n=1 Tax=Desulfurivibrio alkaliphilus TaxID=427923 RepID=UPI0012FF0752|nr:hypothetical protein [Desulfurivibrio alkaliphilus]
MTFMRKENFMVQLLVEIFATRNKETAELPGFKFAWQTAAAYLVVSVGGHAPAQGHMTINATAGLLLATIFCYCLQRLQASGIVPPPWFDFAIRYKTGC